MKNIFSKYIQCKRTKEHPNVKGTEKLVVITNGNNNNNNNNNRKLLNENKAFIWKLGEPSLAEGTRIDLHSRLGD